MSSGNSACMRKDIFNSILALVTPGLLQCPVNIITSMCNQTTPNGPECRNKVTCNTSVPVIAPCGCSHQFQNSDTVLQSSQFNCSFLSEQSYLGLNFSYTVLCQWTMASGTYTMPKKKSQTFSSAFVIWCSNLPTYIVASIPTFKKHFVKKILLLNSY